MTNQQGAPEALTLAGAVDHWARCDFGLRGDEMRKAAAELRRLHAENERLAALVEAQQPAAHVQNPGEIKHVVGDVSKSGPGSNMTRAQVDAIVYACRQAGDDSTYAVVNAALQAQQPAPSAAADRPIASVGAKAAAHVAQQFGGCPECGSRSCVARQCARTVSHAAQVVPGVQWQCGPQATAWALPAHPPSRLCGCPDCAPSFAPTPQADSQPAPVVGTIAHVGTGKTTLTGAITSALRAASTEADSVTAPAGALPEGWVPLVITYEGQYPEEVAYGPKVLMDRLGKWLGKYFAHLLQAKSEEPAMQQLHDLLFTAQRTTGEQQAAAINQARLVLHELRAAKSSLLSRADSRCARVLNEAFDCARAALNHCPDRASIAHILETLRTRVDKAVLTAARADSVLEEGVSREGWVERAMRVYLIAGDTEDEARECAEYQWKQLDLDDIPDPYYAAMEDIEGRGPAPQADSVLEDAARLKEAVGLLEELAEHDSYSTEYDGRMISVCPECGEQDGEHRPNCAFVRAKTFLAASKQGANHD